MHDRLVASEAPVDVERPPPRKRSPNKKRRISRNLNPSVRNVLADGKPALLVELSGARAAGRFMSIDADDWLRVSSELGPCWTVAGSNRPSSWLVASGAEAAAAWARAAGQRGAAPVASLARVILSYEAVKGMVVRFRNGNPFDLRRANLLPLPRKEARSYRPDMPPVQIEEIH